MIAFKCKECGVDLSIPKLDDIATEEETVIALQKYNNICVSCMWKMIDEIKGLATPPSKN